MSVEVSSLKFQVYRLPHNTRSGRDLKDKTQSMEVLEEHNCGKARQADLLQLQNDQLTGRTWVGTMKGNRKLDFKKVKS